MLQLLCATPDRLQPGLLVLGQQLVLDDGLWIDLLARDESGRPVVVLWCGADLAQAIGRVAAVWAAFHQGRFLLERLFARAGLDAHARPRFVLLGLRFAAVRPDDLLQLVGGFDVSAFECRLVTAFDGRPELHLAALARSAAAEVPGTSEAGAGRVARESAVDGLGELAVEAVPGAGPQPTEAFEAPPAEEHGEASRSAGGGHAEESGGGPTSAKNGGGVPAPVLDDVDLLVRAEATPECRRLCLAARDSIRSLSSLVTQCTESDRIRFLVEAVPLATLIPRGGSLAVRVGEEGGPAFDVRDDEGYNASLNAIFSHYFSRFAVRA